MFAFFGDERGILAHKTCPGGGHVAEWNLRKSNGQFAGSGDEFSGVDIPIPVGKKLTFPEQSWYGHTEGKIISELMDAGRLTPGTALEITGEIAPCSQCRNIMQWASETFKMDIKYSYQPGKAWIWHNGTLLQTG